MQQQTIDKQIRETRSRQRISAGFWLIKHLDEMTVYEQSLITFIWLHVGTKHSDWVLPDEDVMRYMKCGRTKFYDCLQSCQTRSLMIVTPLGGGLRRYRLVESNLVETTPVEAQRKYYELLGRSPREIDMLVSSVIRTADPPRGRPVRHTDAPNKEEEQEEEQQEVQETSSPPSLTLPTKGAPPGGQPDGWATAAKALVSCGILKAEESLSQARANGATAQQVLDVVELWKRRAGANKRGALVNRIKRLVPGDDLELRWPAPLVATQRSTAGSAREVILAGRRQGLDDDRIRQQLAAAGLEWDS